jgi:hypothetical protein
VNVILSLALMGANINYCSATVSSHDESQILCGWLTRYYFRSDTLS